MLPEGTGGDAEIWGGCEGRRRRNLSAPRCLPREACASFYPGLKTLGNNSGAGSSWGRKRAQGWRTPPSPAPSRVECVGEAHRDPAGCVWPLGEAVGLRPPCLQPWDLGWGPLRCPQHVLLGGSGGKTGPGWGGRHHTGLPVAARQHTEGWVVLGAPPVNGPKGVTGGAQSGTALFGDL